MIDEKSAVIRFADVPSLNLGRLGKVLLTDYKVSNFRGGIETPVATSITLLTQDGLELCLTATLDSSWAMLLDLIKQQASTLDPNDVSVSKDAAHVRIGADVVTFNAVSGNAKWGLIWCIDEAATTPTQVQAVADAPKVIINPNVPQAEPTPVVPAVEAPVTPAPVEAAPTTP